MCRCVNGVLCELYLYVCIESVRVCLRVYLLASVRMCRYSCCLNVQLCWLLNENNNN